MGLRSVRVQKGQIGPHRNLVVIRAGGSFGGDFAVGNARGDDGCLMHRPQGRAASGWTQAIRTADVVADCAAAHAFAVAVAVAVAGRHYLDDRAV